MDLPWEFLRGAFVRRVHGRPLFAAVSGAHLYGFASPDSDYDLRGAHLTPLARVVSLFPPGETIEFSGVEEGREMDVVSHEAAKFFSLMLRKNGYVMEQIFSPLVVIGGPDHDELRRIASTCVTRHIYHHYRGFADNQERLLEKEERKKAKSLLYWYRVLLTGIHVLRTGRIEANLVRLLDLYPQPGVADLIAAKVREKATLEDSAAAIHQAACRKLRDELDKAFAESSLPDEPRGAKDLDAFLVRLRLENT